MTNTKITIMDLVRRYGLRATVSFLTYTSNRALRDVASLGALHICTEFWTPENKFRAAEAKEALLLYHGEIKTTSFSKDISLRLSRTYWRQKAYSFHYAINLDLDSAYAYASHIEFDSIETTMLAFLARPDFAAINIELSGKDEFDLEICQYNDSLSLRNPRRKRMDHPDPTGERTRVYWSSH